MKNFISKFHNLNINILLGFITLCLSIILLIFFELSLQKRQNILEENAKFLMQKTLESDFERINYLISLINSNQSQMVIPNHCVFISKSDETNIQTLHRSEDFILPKDIYFESSVPIFFNQYKYLSYIYHQKDTNFHFIIKSEFGEIFHKLNSTLLNKHSISFSSSNSNIKKTKIPFYAFRLNFKSKIADQTFFVDVVSYRNKVLILLAIKYPIIFLSFLLIIFLIAIHYNKKILNDTKKKLIKNFNHSLSVQNQNLNDLNKFLSTTMDNIQEAIFTITNTGKITFVNNVTCQLLGIEKNKAIDKSITSIINLKTLNNKNYRIPIEEALNSKKKISFQDNILLSRENQKDIFVSGCIFPISNKSNNTNLLLILKNIDEQYYSDKLKEIMLNITNLSLTNIKISDFYKKIHQEIQKIINAEHFFIALYNAENETFFVPFEAGIKDDLEEYDIKGTLSEQVIITKKTQIFTDEDINDLIEKKIISLKGHLSKQWIGVPLIIEEKIIGLLAIQSFDRRDEFKEREIELLEFIANHIGLAIKRKQIEKELIQSNETFNIISNNLPGIIFIYDVLPDGSRKFVYTGPGLKNLIGEKQELTINYDVDKFFSFVPKEDMQRIQEKSAENKNPLDIEYRILRADNSYCWVRSISSTVSLPNNIERVTGVLLDITEVKHSYEAFKLSEERFKSLFEQSPIAMQIFDNKGNLISVNNAWKKLWNLAKMPDYNIYNDEQILKSGIIKAFNDACNGKTSLLPTIKYSVSSSSKKSKTRWFSINIYPLRGITDEIDYIIVMSDDKTETIIARNEILESRTKFQEIVEHSSDCIFIYDKEGNILECNSKASQVYGYSKEEFCSINLVDLVPERFKSHFEGQLNDKHLTGDTPKERINIKKNGDEFTIELIIKHVKMNNQDRYIAFIRDLSQKKKLEAKIIEAQKMDSIGNLAAGVAHDFNNMLGGISGYASLLLMEESETTKKNYIQGILNAVDRSAELTQKLLAFGRRGKNLVKAVNLNNTINETTMILERSIDKNIKIVKSLDDSLYSVDADPSQMNQIILNLCVNATEAMNGIGILSIITKNVELDSSILFRFPNITPGKYIKLSVSDTGCGIDEETLKHIFEPFFTTKKHGSVKGTGLGLATVYGIVKNHNGIIDISSEVNKGTTFDIYLPKGKKSHEVSNKNNKCISKRRLANILIIEDEPILREMLSEMIISLGHSFLEAENGLEGVNLYKENYTNIDLVILDLMMPVMDGKEAFEKMKEINPDIKAILATGYGKNELAQQVMDIGVKILLPKPFKLDSLQKAILDLI